MPQETYHGVPRNKIPWGPTIDYEKCASCGKCREYCTLGVFGSKEKNREKQSVVKNPNNCVVFCTGCENQCPVGAIKFPSKRETRELIMKLQKTPKH